MVTRPARGSSAASAVLAGLAATAVASVVAASVASAPSDLAVSRTVQLGRSVDGRSIVAYERGDQDSLRKVLVVGCIHGNECAGMAVAADLATTAPPETDLWIVPDLNPDGQASDTRGNAHDVDLNRNFPRRWRPLSGIFASGRQPLSEPESRLAADLVERVRPGVSIWFHQHLDVVDDSTGSKNIERRFAHAAGMRLGALAREPGSAVTWETYCLMGASAFVVELPAGALTASQARRLARATLTAAAASSERRPQLTARRSCLPATSR